MREESLGAWPPDSPPRPLEQDARGAEPTDHTETALCEIFADLAGVAHVSADDHFFEQLNADSMLMAHFCARVRKHPDLPPVSMKDIYRHPTIRELSAALRAATPAEPTLAGAAPLAAPTPDPPVQEQLLGILTDVLASDGATVDSHFFDDLGADSMVMAQFCARVRKRPDLPSVSIKDVYRHPDHPRPGHGPRTGGRPAQQPVDRDGAGRGAGRRPEGGAGPGRRPLLRRPGRRLAGHGPVLRAGPEAGGPAVGVDEGRLPAPDDRALATALADAAPTEPPRHRSCGRPGRPRRPLRSRRPAGTVRRLRRRCSS